MTHNLLVRVQPGQLPVRPGSEGCGAREQSRAPKPPAKGPLGVDANLQAASRVNPQVAPSYRNPPSGGCWECRASFPKAKAGTGMPPATGASAAPGSPASQGWHAGTVTRGNAGGPHVSRFDLQPGNPAYKAAPEVAGDGREGVGGERTSVDGRDNTTRPEQRLPTSAVLVVCRERPTPVPEG